MGLFAGPFMAYVLLSPDKWRSPRVTDLARVFPHTPAGLEFCTGAPAMMSVRRLLSKSKHRDLFYEKESLPGGQQQKSQAISSKQSGAIFQPRQHSSAPAPGPKSVSVSWTCMLSACFSILAQRTQRTCCF